MLRLSKLQCANVMASNKLAYRTFVFDCDGVVLDSNRLKTEAFRTAALPYGGEAAEKLVDYHVENGGISRFVKFRYFLENLIPQGAVGPDLESLLNGYAEAVRQGLLECDIAEGLTELRKVTGDARWLIVSGGSQAELRDVFSERGIDAWFDGGIFGSPDNKDEILSRELKSGNIALPALFIGDSIYDYRAASTAELDFVFATYWTEVPGWQEFVTEHHVDTISSINELVCHLVD